MPFKGGGGTGGVVSRSVSPAILLMGLAACPAAARSPNPIPPRPAWQSQDPGKPQEEKKTKKTWTNDNISELNGNVSVAHDAKDDGKTKSKKSAKPGDAHYAASTRKQLEKFQDQIKDIDKQIADLRNFSKGEPSATAGTIKLNHNYDREPIDVQIRSLEDKKKDLQGKMDALFDEARKRAVEPGELR